MTETGKRYRQSENGGTIEKRSSTIQTFLLSIATAGVVGCFGFLWNLNNSVTRLQERDTENIRTREETLLRINNMQLDIRDIRERLIRVEANKKP